LSTAQELDGAERNLALARSEGEAARATKASLDRIQATREERAGGGAGLVPRFPIVAPLGGIVLTTTRVQGEIVDVGDELFRIRDTARMWVEGRISEFDLRHVGATASAVVTLAALPNARLEVAAEVGGLWTLPSIDTTSRTAVLRCELANADGALKAGMLAELEISVARVDAAVVLPVEAVVTDQGLPTAYVMLEGELFQKRELELGVKDGAFVEVRRGVVVGERVATRGAHLVRLAALSPASFGAGHQH
jgi:membrane fusion protein, heavy metal efflux system